MQAWKDKVIIITGSASGIGLATALEAGRQGARVVLNSRNQDKLDQAQAHIIEHNIPVLACQGDVTDYARCEGIVKDTLDRFGRIDLLINNAALNAIASFEELKPEVFRKIIDINILGAVNMTKAVLPYIRENKGGILFIGSLMGIHGMGNYSVYATSKMALRALTESLRIELQDTGIYLGLAYVACTENSPDKTFLNAEGENVPEPPRRRVRSEKPEAVALQLLKMAEKRRWLKYFTLLGKINALMSKLFPWILHRVFRKTYLGDRKLQEEYRNKQS